MTSRIDFETVKSSALGKWPGIFAALGIAVGDGRHCPCPACGGKDRFRFDDKDGAGSYYCNQCGAGSGPQLVEKCIGGDWQSVFGEIARIVGANNIEVNLPQEERPADPAALRQMCLDSWPTQAGDFVHDYLVGRGLQSIPKTRTAPRIWNAEKKTWARAMLAIFTLPDGQAVTIHRTFTDAAKLGLTRRKMKMPTLKPGKGGACRLYHFEEGRLGIAEGIETAIKVHEHYGIPVWAATSDGLLKNFIPPAECTGLLIVGDNDSAWKGDRPPSFAGQAAAYALAKLQSQKRRVDVVIPPGDGDDFLDWANRGR